MSLQVNPVTAPIPILRNTPVQARSNATLEKIVETALIILSNPSVGRDKFTTSMLSEQSGLSIGTIYRYFPDRVAVLDHVWPHRRDQVFSL